MKILDYEVIFDHEWNVWTPYETGACIGSGATKTAALRDAIEAMQNTANMMRGELEALTI